MKADWLTASLVHSVAAGIAVLMTIGAYVMGVEPRLELDVRRRRLQDGVAAIERDALIAATALRSERAALQSRRGAAAQESHQLESESRLNDRMLRLARLAETRGLMITAIDPGRAQTVGPHALIPAQLAGKADYLSVITYLSALRETFPDIRVDKIALTAVPGDGQGVTFDLRLTWFSVAEKPGGRDDRAARAAPRDVGQ